MDTAADEVSATNTHSLYNLLTNQLIGKQVGTVDTSIEGVQYLSQ